MAPGARNKFGLHVFEPDVSRKQMYCIEESSLIVVCWNFSALGVL